jgi:hypothetical protein
MGPEKGGGVLGRLEGKGQPEPAPFLEGEDWRHFKPMFTGLAESHFPGLDLEGGQRHVGVVRLFALEKNEKGFL